MPLDKENPAEVFSRPNQEARIHDLEQFTLWAETPDRPGFRARMVFGERNGAPRITVFTNFEERPNILYVGMSPQIFWMFLNAFEEMLSQPGKQKQAIENMDNSPNADKKAGMPDIVRNRLMFGKSEEGVCWLSVQQEGVKNIYFKLLPSAYHHFIKPDGTRLTADEASVAYTKSFIATLRIAVGPYISRIKHAFEKGVMTKKADKAEGGPGTSFSTFNSDDLDY
jgi:hypothetical protein